MDLFVILSIGICIWEVIKEHIETPEQREAARSAKKINKELNRIGKNLLGDDYDINSIFKK